MPLALILMSELKSAVTVGMTAISTTWMLCIGFSQIRSLAEWSTFGVCDCAWNGHADSTITWSPFSGPATFDSELYDATPLEVADELGWMTGD
eukprot:208614-Amphidinium_carterae.1